MTTVFRLDAIDVDTTRGMVSHRFPSPLTILAGSVGVGKTTLLELVKHAFGGNAMLAQVVTSDVREVSVAVTIGTSRFLLARSVDPNKSKVVRVTDLVSREELSVHHVGAQEPSLDTLLLGALGLPTDAKAASRSANSKKAGNRISFADVFGFMYVSQAEINNDIAKSQDNYYEPKRKAVFELLFGLTNEELLGLRSQWAEENSALEKAVLEHATVVQFLRDSQTATRIDAQKAHDDAIRTQEGAAIEMVRLREEMGPVVDRETQTLRDLLNEAERDLAEVRELAFQLTQTQAALSKERHGVMHDLDRLERMRDAGNRLADIEFKVCPRCMQDVSRRETAHGHCRLCQQPEPGRLPDAEVVSKTSYEQQQLRDQLAEIEEHALGVSAQLVDVHTTSAHRQELVMHLSARLEVRTRDRVTPRLQAFTDASRHQAEATARLQASEGVLRQWDRADDLDAAAEEAGGRVARLKSEIKAAEDALSDRKRELFDELDEEFEETIRGVGVPSVESAKISRSTYLPMLNGASFTKFSPAGGGIRTATQVAYWISLMTVALRRGDTFYPAFMLIDSPRTSLNSSEGLARALYGRIVTQVDVDSRKLQVIIADNELPEEYRGRYQQQDFDYANPTIGTIPHPGPAAVTRLVKDAN